MPTAHQRQRRILIKRNRQEKNRKNNYSFGKIFRIFLPVLIILAAFLFIKLSTREWNGHDKLSFAFPKEDGSVGITVLDPTSPEMTTIIIPGDTQVEVAAGYGTLRLKSVWQLGVNEKKEGELLARTVTRNFLFPVYLWSDKDASAISRQNLPGIFKFVFFPVKTNLGFGDRLSVALFAAKIKNIEKNEIDLAKSQFLHKETLPDGSAGFVYTGTASERLTVFFSDTDFSDTNLKVNILDGTGTYGPAQKVGAVIEAMGGKVVAIDKNQSPSDITCHVYGKNKNVVTKVSKVFGCESKNIKTDFDLEIKLGSKFSKVF